MDSNRLEVFCEKSVLRNFANFTGKHLRPEACNFIKKETLAQVFSCEFCEIFKNTLSYRAPLECLYFSGTNWPKLLDFGSVTNLVFAFCQSSVFIDFDNTVWNENEKDGFIVSRKNYSIKLLQCYSSFSSCENNKHHIYSLLRKYSILKYWNVLFFKKNCLQEFIWLCV